MGREQRLNEMKAVARGEQPRDEVPNERVIAETVAYLVQRRIDDLYAEKKNFEFIERLVKRVEKLEQICREHVLPDAESMLEPETEDTKTDVPAAGVATPVP